MDIPSIIDWYRTRQNFFAGRTNQWPLSRCWMIYQNSFQLTEEVDFPGLDFVIHLLSTFGFLVVHAACFLHRESLVLLKLYKHSRDKTNSSTCLEWLTANLPEVWTVVTEDDFVDLKLNILDFDDSISQAFLQTDIDLEGNKDFDFNHLFHHPLWSEGNCTTIASCTQPYSKLTERPFYPSLEYVTTICSSCHHCTNHWIQAGQHTRPENPGGLLWVNLLDCASTSTWSAHRESVYDSSVWTSSSH